MRSAGLLGRQQIVLEAIVPWLPGVVTQIPPVGFLQTAIEIDDDAVYGDAMHVMDICRGAGVKTLGLMTKS